MPQRTQGRDRRAKGVAVAVLALAVAGSGLTAYGLSQQETRTPPPAAVSEGGHAGHHMGPAPTSTSPSSDPAPEPTAERMSRSRPTSISIPSLGVSSSITDLGLQADRTMEVPQDGTSTGWFTGSPTPGELGPSVLAAHVTWDKEPAVFFELGSMREGQRVEVERADGSTAVFEVSDIGQYPKTKFPTDDVYGEVDHAALRLITCGGHFDGETGHHVDNVVVYAELVDERAAAR